MEIKKDLLVMPDYDNHKVLIYDPKLEGYVEYDTRDERYVFLALKNALHPDIYAAVRGRDEITDETRKRDLNIGLRRKIKSMLSKKTIQ